MSSLSEVVFHHIPNSSQMLSGTISLIVPRRCPRFLDPGRTGGHVASLSIGCTCCPPWASGLSTCPKEQTWWLQITAHTTVLSIIVSTRLGKKSRHPEVVVRSIPYARNTSWFHVSPTKVFDVHGWTVSPSRIVSCILIHMRTGERWGRLRRDGELRCISGWAFEDINKAQGIDGLWETEIRRMRWGKVLKLDDGSRALDVTQ